MCILCEYRNNQLPTHKFRGRKGGGAVWRGSGVEGERCVGGAVWRGSSGVEGEQCGGGAVWKGSSVYIGDHLCMYTNII